MDYITFFEKLQKTDPRVQFTKADKYLGLSGSNRLRD